MLGPEEYKVRCSGSNTCDQIALPEGVAILDHMDNIIHFRIENPEESNPVLIRNMVNAGINVISFHKVHRSLENAYLAAVQQATDKE